MPYQPTLDSRPQHLSINALPAFDFSPAVAPVRTLNCQEEAEPQQSSGEHEFHYALLPPLAPKLHCQSKAEPEQNSGEHEYHYAMLPAPGFKPRQGCSSLQNYQ